MKTILFLSLFCVFLFNSNAQYNTPWTTNILNTTQNGFIGIGTKNNNGIPNTPLPNFNLHLHGTVDYINSGSQTSLTPINYGKTVRLGFTNSVTYSGENDGTLLMAAQNDFYLWNREDGNLYLKSKGASMTFDYPSKAIWIGGSPSTNAKYGYLNVITSKNGLYIETLNTTKKSLTINSRNDVTTAIEIFGTNQTTPNIKFIGSGTIEAKQFTSSIPSNNVSIEIKDNISNNTNFKVFGSGVFEAKRFEAIIPNNEASIVISDNLSNKVNFKVFGSGEVYARKYVATINNFPDYVFKKDYKLLPLNQLRNYISANGKLPNLPSAVEVEENGLDMGETNRLLVEKVEELTLYILQLEDRINKLEKD